MLPREGKGRGSCPSRQSMKNEKEVKAKNRSSLFTTIQLGVNRRGDGFTWLASWFRIDGAMENGKTTGDTVTLIR